jgi:Ca2+-binding RTX toxin-like protein
VAPAPGSNDVYGGPGVDSVYYGYYGSPMWMNENGLDMIISLDDVANDGEALRGATDNVHSDNEMIYTGPGNDTVTGSEADIYIETGLGNDVISGGGGRDNVLAQDGDDTLNGDAADDRLSGGYGDDLVRGAAGDDYLDGSDSLGRDTFSGGPGVDFIALLREDDVSVTLDNVANDGQAGERDNVRSGVEDVTTGQGNDTIVGTAGDNDFSGGAGNDTLLGRGGNDGIDGGLGRDALSGGHGVDSISGGGNVDTILSQDATADYVTCGSSVDSVDRDRKDQVAVDCETLT